MFIYYHCLAYILAILTILPFAHEKKKRPNEDITPIVADISQTWDMVG